MGGLELTDVDHARGIGVEKGERLRKPHGSRQAADLTTTGTAGKKMRASLSYSGIPAPKVPSVSQPPPLCGAESDRISLTEVLRIPNCNEFVYM